MANKIVIFTKLAVDGTEDGFFAMKFIDLGGGNFTIRLLDQTDSGYPSQASAIQATGASLIAGGSASVSIGSTVVGGNPLDILFVSATGELSQNDGFKFNPSTLSLLIGENTGEGQIRIAGTSEDATQLTFIRLVNVLTPAQAGGATAINLDLTVENNRSLRGINSTVTANSAIGAGTTLAGALINATVSGSSGQNQVWGIQSFLNIAPGAGPIASGARSVEASIVQGSTGTYPLTDAVLAQIFQTGVGVLQNAICLKCIIGNFVAGAITNARGVSIQSWTNLGGTFTNIDGIFIDASIDIVGATVHPIRSLSINTSLFSGPIQSPIILFEGDTAAESAVKGSGDEVHIRAGDDSDYHGLRASVLNAEEGSITSGRVDQVAGSVSITANVGDAEDGILAIQAANGNFATLLPGNPTISRNISLPDADGILALASPPVVPDDTGQTLSPEQSGSTFTNEGAAALVPFVLPPASANLTYTFYVQNVNGIEVTADGTNTIRLASAESTPGGTLTSIVPGDSVTLQAINSTEWVAIATVGAGWVAA